MAACSRESGDPFERGLAACAEGQAQPVRLADLAHGRMKAKRAALIEALTGRFDDHHAELAAILLAQINGLTGQIETLTARIETVVSEIPAAQGVNEDGTTGPRAGRGPEAPVLPAIDRLAAVPGIFRNAAQVIIAELGLDMSRFPTAAHLVSWARLCPRTLQSGARERPGRTAKGNRYLKGIGVLPVLAGLEALGGLAFVECLSLDPPPEF
jgi:transposase